ncbi:MAG: HAMP domain-containing sensor histidine kinase, partial [Saprospiraceae bacterium]
SIQYLEHAFKTGNQEDFPALVKSVSDTLIEQIDNLAKIATEFSNFAKMPPAQLEKIALNDLVSSVHDLFRKRSEIDFNLYVPIDEVYVEADRSYLIRILNNLLKNAVQAIPASRKGVIDIKLTMEHGDAILSIQDNGVGIPKEMREKVFFPNFTTKSSGTGLGLAMTKSIIESMQGKIYFKTKVNEGTAFFVEIPLIVE